MSLLVVVKFGTKERTGENRVTGRTYKGVVKDPGRGKTTGGTTVDVGSVVYVTKT